MERWFLGTQGRRCALAGILVAGAAAGASVYTVTLPDGATNTLDEAFAQGYVTSSVAGETPTRAGLHAAADLRVAGGGRLEIDVDLKSAGYTGEVHVAAGAVLRLTALGALGDTDHGTFVADGATLETECLDATADDRLDFAGERLAFAGAGVGGMGALVARTPERKERNGVWGGTRLTMTGDAKIVQVGTYQDFPCNNANNSLDMNGHTLTFCDTDGAGAFCIRTVVTNPGHFVISRARATMNNYAKLGGDASNTVTLRDGASLDLYESTGVGAKPWTVRVLETNGLKWPFTTTSYGGTWDGPLLFEGRAAIGACGQGNGAQAPPNENVTILRGPVTARDTLAICWNNMAVAHAPTIELHAPSNVFDKGLAVSNVVLKAMADGALPAAMGTGVFSAHDAALAFSEGQDRLGDAWRLPKLEVTGSVSVGDCAGAWAGVLKKAGATLTCSMDAPDFTALDLEAGTAALEEPDRNFNSGLYEGHKAYAYWHKEGASPELLAVRANLHCDNADNCQTNGVTASVRFAYETAELKEMATNEFGEVVTANGYTFCYQGYVWNHDATNVTWTFAASETTVSTLWINGKSVYGRQSTGASDDICFGNAVLTPGPNPFWWRIGVSGRKVGPAMSVPKVAAPTWTDKAKCGLVYDRLGRGTRDPGDYARLENTGDAPLFTLTIPGTAAHAALKEAKTVRRLERLSGTAGAVFAAPSRTLVVQELVGCPAVNVASAWLAEAGVTVTARLVARAADLAAGRAFATDGALVFGEGAALELEGDMKALRPSGAVLATAAGGITGAPKVAGEAAGHFRVARSADAKALLLVYVPGGTLLLVR